MDSVFPSGLWNISRLTRDSGVCMPAFDRGVMMHRRNQPEEKYTDTLRHPSSSNQTRWQEQTDGFIWCLTKCLCLNIRKMQCNHITHRNKLSRLCCFLSVIFLAWIYKGLGSLVWEGSCSSLNELLEKSKTQHPNPRRQHLDPKTSNKSCSEDLKALFCNGKSTISV